MSQAQMLVAVGISRLLASAGLVHPAGDRAGDEQVLQWAELFIKLNGVLPPSDRREECATYESELREFVWRKATIDQMVPSEHRDTVGYEGDDLEFERQFAAAQRFRELPFAIPRRAADDLLMERVRLECTRRAVRQIEQHGVIEGDLVHDVVGSLQLLRFRGFPIAVAQVGQDRDPAAWLVQLRGILVQAHEVARTVEQEEVPQTPRRDRRSFGYG